MARKTKSSLLAQGIELIESGVKKVKEFNDNIDPLLLDSEKLKQIKPLIDNLVKTLTPPTEQEKAEQEKAEREKADKKKTDQEKADREPPDPELDVCLICANTCEPDKRPEGTIILDGLVKTCPAFTLNTEPSIPKKKYDRMVKLLKNATPESD